MWGPVLVMTLGAALNPVRLGLILLVISRPRPVQNLFAFWVGCLTGCVWAAALAIALLHATPVKSFADDLATSSIVPHIQVGIGVLALFIAALLAARSLTRRRRQARLPAASSNTSTAAAGSNTTLPISRLLSRVQTAPIDRESVIRRLLRRAHNAWENGSLWIAFVVGFFFGGPEPDVLVFLIAIIVASGAAIGTKVSAAIVFVIGLLAVAEITLVCYLLAPAKTQTMVQRLHDWSLAHRRKILIALFTAGGITLVGTGMGSI
ncbi:MULTISPECIES: GAP family protein [unclassified Mycobacterium]|uniref:GAP family protein n=1 Tax=unclassified Mycobacterium TaxID=2642494 RepID=UPI00073FEB97|nr:MULTISPECIES: GAP family protein [unclassified Mycobacterium]KUH80884.1 gap protein [Mycobacterium sp. GA-0227b]KUH92323.1 gap protein [Mycobacterium sp. GA-1999]